MEVSLKTGDITISDMMQTVAKAYLAEGHKDAVSSVRNLAYPRLLGEFTRAIVVLRQKGLLSSDEIRGANDWAKDYLETYST